MYIPSNIQNYEELKMDLPSEKLELDWVYPLSIIILRKCILIRNIRYTVIQTEIP